MMKKSSSGLTGGAFGGLYKFFDVYYPFLKATKIEKNNAIKNSRTPLKIKEQTINSIWNKGMLYKNTQMRLFKNTERKIVVTINSVFSRIVVQGGSSKLFTKQHLIMNPIIITMTDTIEA